MDWIRKIPIGQYVDGESGWLRWIDPRMKLAWVLLFLLTPVLSSAEWRLGLVLSLLVITFFSHLPSRIWWRPLLILFIFSSLLGLLAMILPASELAATLMVRNPNELPNAIVLGPHWELISLGPLIVDRRSLELGIKTSTLIFTVVHSVNLMLITTSPEDLVWALHWFISPLAFLGLPIDRISFQLLLALRFIPLVQEEFQNLLRSLSVRAVDFKKLGFKASLGLILSVGERLLANILLRSEQGAQAFMARGGSFLPPRYFRPSRTIVSFSCINICAGFLLVMVLVLRFKCGS